jgi:AcrR family transcriptional regulator
MKGDLKKRLSRDQWLAQALEYIAHAGHVKIRIYELVKKLGVTEGSFYWHFKNREDFLISLVDYWANEYTNSVIETVSRVRGDASVRLLALMQKVIGENLSGFDTTMWALAVQEPAVAPIIREVYNSRVKYVRSIFTGLGLKGRELDLRTRAFVSFMSMESDYFQVKSKKRQQRLIEETHGYFTRL